MIAFIVALIGVGVHGHYHADEDSTCWTKFDEASCTEPCTYHNNICQPKFNDKNCFDGDVRLSSFPRGKPEIFFNGKWNELCADKFASTDNGAKTFCRQLGFNNGKSIKVKRRYDGQAIHVGSCIDDDIGNGVLYCTGGANGPEQRTIKRCKNRKRKGIDIVCMDARPVPEGRIPIHHCNGEKIQCTDSETPGFCAQTKRLKRCRKKQYARKCNKTCGRCNLMNSQ